MVRMPRGEHRSSHRIHPEQVVQAGRVIQVSMGDNDCVQRLQVDSCGLHVLAKIRGLFPVSKRMRFPPYSSSAE